MQGLQTKIADEKSPETGLAPGRECEWSDTQLRVSLF